MGGYSIFGQKANIVSERRVTLLTPRHLFWGGVVLLIEQQVSTIMLRFEELMIGCALLLIRIFRTCNVQFIKE